MRKDYKLFLSSSDLSQYMDLTNVITMIPGERERVGETWKGFKRRDINKWTRLGGEDGEKMKSLRGLFREWGL